MIKGRRSLMSGLVIMALLGFSGGAGRSAVKLEKGNPKPRIAVADFEARAPLAPSEAAFISGFVRADIIAAGRLNVIDKNSMNKALSEQGFPQTGCSSAECAVQIGKILNVKQMVVGSCGQILGKYVITMNVVDVKSAKIVYSDDVSVTDPDVLRDAIRGMVEKYVTGGKFPAKPAKVKRIEFPEGEKVNIAINDFEALAPLSQSEAAFISDFVRYDFVKTARFNVVEKNNMDNVLAEQGFRQRDYSSAENAVRMGKILNVKQMVVGSCGQLLGKYIVTMNVVNVENAMIVYSDEVLVADPDTLRDAIRGMVEKYVTGGKVGAAPAEPPATVKEAAPIKRPEVPRGEKVNVAVDDFEALAPFSPSEAAVVSNFVRADIVTAGRFNVVDKNSMDKVLAEQGFQQTETSSAEHAVRVGKILNVKMIINGSCSQLLGKYVITMNAVDVESAKIVYSDDISVANPDELRDAVKKMVEKFSRNVK
ncbi:MAG: CsgG/HfaB family protein [bacterium]